jgi:hypothetical protein
MSRINETTDKYTTQTNTADGWAAQLAADRNNYQKGTHENLYGHDLAAAQSFVAHQFGQL